MNSIDKRLARLLLERERRPPQAVRQPCPHCGHLSTPSSLARHVKRCSRPVVPFLLEGRGVPEPRPHARATASTLPEAGI
jgi:hypothetical protein